MVRSAATAGHYTIDNIVDIQGITTVTESSSPFPVEVHSKLVRGAQQTYIVVCSKVLPRPSDSRMWWTFQEEVATAL